jgi:hypothetical protein
MMREITYGGPPERPPRGFHPRGTMRLDNFVLSLPYLIGPAQPGDRAPIPSRAVLNSIFRSGKFSAGMSGNWEWEPFEIDQSEYEELVAALSNGERPVRVMPEPPRWVETRDEWNIWIASQDHDSSSEEGRRLRTAVEDSRRAYEMARKTVKEHRDPSRVVELWRVLLRTERDFSDFLNGNRVGSTQEKFEDPEIQDQAKIGDARMRLRIAEEIGDRSLIEQHRRELTELGIDPDGSGSLNELLGHTIQRHDLGPPPADTSQGQL